MEDVLNKMRIVMMGKTGAGKSSVANTIFGKDKFNISHTLNSETRQCQAETRSLNGRSITLVDTPGLFDTDRPEEEMKPEIVRCITECAPGPHAFLIVLKVDIFTDQEQVGISKIQEYFSDEVFKYATVVITHGDQLPERETIKDFVCKNKILSDLVKKCGGRCHVVDNKYWKDKPKNEYRSNQFQMEELLKTIDKMVMENNGGCYTNEMLQKVEEMIEQEEENIRQSSGNMTEEEIREKAKSRVYTYLISLKDVTGAGFFKALLGVAVVVAALKSVPTLVNTAETVARAFGARAGAFGATGGAVVTRIFGAAVGTFKAATAAAAAVGAAIIHLISDNNAI